MRDKIMRIDWGQARALLCAGLRMDWRGSFSQLMTTHTGKRRRFPAILLVLGMNMLYSIFLAALLDKSPDLFTGLVLSSAGAMILVALPVLLDFNHIVISPDDYHIIAPLPVNSKSFYAAKLAHFLFFVTILVGAVSVIPAVVAAFRFHSVWTALAVIIEFWTVSVFCALLIIVIYTTALKTAKPGRLERILGYLQMAFMMLGYIGFIFGSKLSLPTLALPDVSAHWFWHLSPSYWFAVWVGPVAHGWDPAALGLGIMGLILFVLVGKAAFSFLSLSYAESLTNLNLKTLQGRSREVPKSIKRIWYKYSCPEDRAVLILTWAQFKHDIRFRLAIISLLPMILFLLWKAMSGKGHYQNPFALAPGGNNDVTSLMAMIAAFYPLGIQGAMQMSKSWGAAWVFYSTPSDYPRLLLATSRLMWPLVIFPLGVLYFILLTYLGGNALQALLHAFFILSLATLDLTIINIFNSRLPFSMENQYGGNTGRLYLAMIIMSVVTVVPLVLVAEKGYGGYAGWAIIMTIALIANWCLNKILVMRLRKISAQWEFAG
jgi:hypothetical protein